VLPKLISCWTARGLVSLQTGQVVDWTAHGLVKS